MKINHENIMKIIYDKKNENLNKIADLLYVYDINEHQFYLQMVEKLELSYKQTHLLMLKLIMISPLLKEHYTQLGDINDYKENEIKVDENLLVKDKE